MRLIHLNEIILLTRHPEAPVGPGHLIGSYQRAVDATGGWWFRVVGHKDYPKKCELCGALVERGWRPEAGCVTSLVFICDAHFDPTAEP